MTISNSAEASLGGTEPAANNLAWVRAFRHHGGMGDGSKGLWGKAREQAGHWIAGGAIVALTGFAPEEWLGRAVHDLHISDNALHLWSAGIDVRVVPITIGVAVVAIALIRQQRAVPAPAGNVAVPTGSATPIAGEQSHADFLALPDRPSIAVLPFANLSGDPEQEYFSDGVADDIITELSRDRALFVIARNSSFTYRGRAIDIRQVGRELGVRYVVEGSVRREAGRVRVTAQLIDATTGSHVWAERYDRALEHVFEVQDEIAEAVARAVRPAVGDAEQRRALRKPPGSLTAWEIYHRGLWHLANHAPGEYEQARRLFKQATDIDPGFASAFAGLALTYILDAMVSATRSFAEAGRLAEAAARKAVALDSNDADAQIVLSMSFVCAGDMSMALEGTKRALALNRNSAAAHEMLGGTLTYTGRTSEGRDEAQIALRINPRDPASTMAAVIIVASYYLEHNYAAAVEWARRFLAGNPANSMPRRYLAAALGQLGRNQEAAAELQAFLADAPHVFEATVRQRPPYVMPEDHKHLLDGMRKAGWQG
jgi:adenylate cyclase